MYAKDYDAYDEGTDNDDDGDAGDEIAVEVV